MLPRIQHPRSLVGLLQLQASPPAGNYTCRDFDLAVLNFLVKEPRDVQVPPSPAGFPGVGHPMQQRDRHELTTLKPLSTQAGFDGWPVSSGRNSNHEPPPSPQTTWNGMMPWCHALPPPPAMVFARDKHMPGCLGLV